MGECPAVAHVNDEEVGVVGLDVHDEIGVHLVVERSSDTTHT